MRVIIAGSRTIGPPDFTVYNLVDVIRMAGVRKQIGPITQLGCGMARGVDSVAWEWAHVAQRITREQFPAQWRDADFNFDHGAGNKRNERMAQWAASDPFGARGGLIAIMHADEPTPGTSDMIERAEKHGLLVYVHLL